MAQFLLDTFTGSAGTLIPPHVGETGATWTSHPAVPGVFELDSSGSAICDVPGTIYASGTPLSADYDSPSITCSA
jgi:hypothetical protein